MNIKLIFGLGNPGFQYHYTRHNVGFLIIDQLAVKFNITNSTNNFNAECYAFFNEKNEKIILIKPQTFMNLSGDCVNAIVRFYKVPIKNVLIIYDDLDLNFGTLRIKKNGSSGGQNGMKDIINKLATQNILRLKVGIGPCQKNAKDFVLSKFSTSELIQINNFCHKIFIAVNAFINDQPIEKIINWFN